jgi:tetratricopeptide (TPR) repeat protein
MCLYLDIGGDYWDASPRAADGEDFREEDGRNERALRHYRAALEANPLVPDTHVSLALLYEKLGLPRTGLAHWKRVLQADPTGHWADVARRRLALH